MDRDIEKRLDRVERKLFPENLKILYDFRAKCSYEQCPQHYNAIYVSNNTVYPITSELNKCSYCGNELVVSDIREHKEIVFED